MYTDVYGWAAFWSGPYTPSSRRNLALQGCLLKVAVNSTREMNFWPRPANLDALVRPDILRFGLRSRAPSRAITSPVENTFYHYFRRSECHKLHPAADLKITVGYGVRLLWGGLSRPNSSNFHLTSWGES